MIGTKSKRINSNTVIRSGSVYLQLCEDILIEIIISSGDSNEEFDCLRNIPILGGIGYHYCKETIAQQRRRRQSTQNSTIVVASAAATANNDDIDIQSNNQSRIVPCVLLQHSSDNNRSKTNDNTTVDRDIIWLNYSKLIIYSKHSFVCN